MAAVAADSLLFVMAEAAELAPPGWERVLKSVHVLSVVAVTGEIADQHPHEQQAADRMATSQTRHRVSR